MEYKRYYGTREMPVPSKVLAIFGVEGESENDLKKFFGKFGEIRNVSLPKQVGANIPKTFGFVEFEQFEVNFSLLKIL
jgi:hypothetical protein